MGKKLMGALDTILSFVGLAALVVLGIRWWRGLPVLPADLVSAPRVAAPASPASATAPAAPRAAAPEPMATAAAILGASESLTPAWRAPDGGGIPEEKSKKATEYHDWAREISVTITSSRFVKSLADLAPAPGSLPESDREALRTAMKAADKHEMLLVCRVSVEYSGQTEVSLGQDGFRLVSVDREVFPSLPVPFSTRDLQPLRTSLLPQGRATGDLVFPVKRGTQADEIIYSSP